VAGDLLDRRLRQPLEGRGEAVVEGLPLSGSLRIEEPGPERLVPEVETSILLAQGPLSDEEGHCGPQQDAGSGREGRQEVQRSGASQDRKDPEQVSLPRIEGGEVALVERREVLIGRELLPCRPSGPPDRLPDRKGIPREQGFRLHPLPRPPVPPQGTGEPSLYGLPGELGQFQEGDVGRGAPPPGEERLQGNPEGSLAAKGQYQGRGRRFPPGSAATQGGDLRDQLPQEVENRWVCKMHVVEKEERRLPPGELAEEIEKALRAAVLAARWAAVEILASR